MNRAARIRRSIQSLPRRQIGAALLIVLLAVALASLLATRMIERSQRDLVRTEALLNTERAWQYASGMNHLALDWIEQLEDDQRIRGTVIDGRWAAPLPVPGGSVTGRVFDLSGRFNLNALASPVPEDALGARLALDRLFGSLNLDRNLAGEIAAWVAGIDSPSGPLYAQYQPPYLRAGLPMLHPSELNWLERYKPETAQRLMPFISTLPGAQSRININRTSPEVLAAWVEGLTLEQAERVLSAAPFDSLQDMLNRPELTGVNRDDFNRRFSVTSRWFLAQARVTLNGQTQDFFRLLDRGGAGYDFRYVSQGTQEPVAPTMMSANLSSQSP